MIKTEGRGEEEGEEGEERERSNLLNCPTNGHNEQGRATGK